MKLIAETAWHHEGDVAFMNKLISDIIHKTKVDVLKLHLTLDLREYMSEDHPVFKNLEKWLIRKEQWNEILNAVVSSDKELMLLLNDTKSVEFGLNYQPSIVEVHSVCLNDINLLSCLKSNLGSNIKVVLGVGGSSLDELESAIHMLDKFDIVLMFGFQNYPTRYQDINFKKMRKIMMLYPEFEFGYADHTVWNEPENILITLFGAALGMQYVEKHVTNVFGQERADWSAAVSIDMCNKLREKLTLLKACSGDGLLKMNSGERDYSVYGPMKKAGILTKEMKIGQKIEMDMLTFKRTAQISDMSQVDVLQSIGKEVSTDLEKGTVLMKKHLK